MADRNQCYQVREQISAFLDNELSSHDAIQMTSHLESCVACRHEYDQTAAIREKLRALPAIPVLVRDTARQRAFARLEQSVRQATSPVPQRQQQSFPHPTLWNRLLSAPTLRPVAATLAVAVVLGISFTLWPSDAPPTANSVSTPSAAEWDNLFHQHDAQAVSFSTDDPLLRRDAAAEAHASLLRQADEEVTGSL